MNTVGVPDYILAAKRNSQYPYRLWYLIATFLFIVAIFRSGSLVISKWFPSQKASGDVEKSGPVFRHATSLKRLPLALVNTYRIVAFRWTITVGSYSLNMAEVFITIAYIVSTYTLEFVNTTTLNGEKLSRIYWINRAGVMAVSQLPLVTVLGSKNNLIGLITGISYEKLNFAHRMCARVVITLVWVHAGTRLKITPAQKFNNKEYEVGLTAAFSVLTLLIVSIRPVRKSAYELFFFIHFFLVVVFLACAYIHTKEPGFHYYVWPCFLFWGLDRFIRFVRLVVFNHSYFGFKSGSGTMDGTVELLSSQLVRLRLRRPPHFHWQPGQTAFLTMPSVSDLPFEAHPFTIASIDITANEEEKSDSSSITPYWKELVFFINVHEGFTKKLGKVAAKGGTVKTFVDGPYGHSPDLSTYDTSVLIAGGSGLSFTLPLLLDAINKAALGKSNTSRLVFIWAIRDSNQIFWISETLLAVLKTVPSTLSVSIRIFVTSKKQESTVRQWDNVFLDPADGNRQSSLVQVTEGNRPDLNTLLKEEANLTTGRMSVSVCGSHAVANATKQALGFSIAGPLSILKGGPSITLHVEAFGYA